MSTTAWERRKALSDQLRAVWDAHRECADTWEHAFNRAKAATVVRLVNEAEIVSGISWDDFQRLQGLRNAGEQQAG